jgi:hypothetical protein
MQKEIDNIIQQALKEDWFNTMTTSDLQGVCEAKAMAILRSQGIKNFNNSLEYMPISDEILNGIYEVVNPF